MNEDRLGDGRASRTRRIIWWIFFALAFIVTAFTWSGLSIRDLLTMLPR